MTIAVSRTSFLDASRASPLVTMIDYERSLRGSPRSKRITVLARNDVMRSCIVLAQRHVVVLIMSAHVVSKARPRYTLLEPIVCIFSYVASPMQPLVCNFSYTALDMQPLSQDRLATYRDRHYDTPGQSTSAMKLETDVRPYTKRC